MNNLHFFLIKPANSEKLVVGGREWGERGGVVGREVVVVKAEKQ